MPTLTVTAKGQITLRRELLQHLGIAPGQQLEVNKLADGVLSLQARPGRSLDAFAGCLPPPKRPLTVEEMSAVIAQGWGGKAR